MVRRSTLAACYIRYGKVPCLLVILGMAEYLVSWLYMVRRGTLSACYIRYVGIPWLLVI
jgi:hypothetical protein